MNDLNRYQALASEGVPVGTGIRVMIVEDEAVVALHLRRELSNLGYTVAGVASSGDQALKLVEEVFPDVILMDIHIQGELDGIDTAARIPRYLHIPVIYLTAYSEDSTLKRAGDTRPYGYLIKPFVNREIHATISVQRQLFVSFDDNYFSLRTTSTAINC